MKRTDTTAQKLARVNRTAERAARVDAMREGRRERAVTFTDRRKKASKDACRKGNW